MAVRSRFRDWGEQQRLVPLESLLSEIRQGVFAGGSRRGDVRVRTIRVSDLHPLLIGAGEDSELSAGVVRRHLAFDGDVLVSRVGRLGQVGCVTQATETLVPREGVFVARPLKKEWGAAIAAALCTEHVREWLGGLMVGTRSASLTMEQLSNVLVPSPRHCDFAQIFELVSVAGKLMKDGREILDRVRGRLGMIMEGAPTELNKRRLTWVDQMDCLRGWGWADVQRHLLISELQLRPGSLMPLGDLVDLDACRVKTIDVPAQARGLENDELRPDWYLALPKAKPVSVSDALEIPTRTTSKRFFGVDGECLLIPTVGDITGPPVVIPAERALAESPAINVPIYWLPLINLATPRALAMVLDHPFVRLQRQLAGAFSTVAHITRDDIAGLMIPVVSEKIMDQWETELQSAHQMFMDANNKANEAIAIAESWYS